MSNLAEEIIRITGERGEVEIRELKNMLNVSADTIYSEIHFLIETGFLTLDKTKSYVRLSNRCKKFVEKNSERGVWSVLLLC